MSPDYALRVVDASSAEPLDLATVKNHLRVDSDLDDAEITSLIVAAREYCEGKIWRALKTQTLELTLDSFPCVIRLPRPPFVSVLSVVYQDSTGAETTIDASQYIVSQAVEPGRLIPVTQWPTFNPYPVEPIKIQYTAGYTAATLPESIKRAMLLKISQLYSNRTQMYGGTVLDNGQVAIDALLAPYKFRSVFP